MPRLDFFAIEQRLAEIVRGELSGVDVLIEEEGRVAAEVPWIEIFLRRADAVTTDQVLAANQRLRHQLRFTIGCHHFSPEGMARAAELRDDLLGRLEVALMKHNTIDGLVEHSWIDVIDFRTAREGEAYISSADLTLVARGVATTL